jgi:hypothetical protein
MSSPNFHVVYLLSGSRWNQEFKFSLRSFERFFSQLGTVWVVGYLPEYINPATVRHVPEPRMNRPGVFVESLAMRLLVDELDDLSEHFILAQDDNYLLRPVTFSDFGPLWVQDLDEVTNRANGPWHLMLWRTYDLLKFQGRTVHNFESHTPMHFHRPTYREFAKAYIPIENAARHRYHGICLRSAYWNSVPATAGSFRRADDYRVGFTEPQHATSEAQIREALQGKTFFFHNDKGLTEPLKRVIEELYPEKSRFER